MLGYLFEIFLIWDHMQLSMSLCTCFSCIPYVLICCLWKRAQQVWTAVLGKNWLQCWLLVYIWEFRFGEVPTISRTDKSYASTVCTNNMVYAEHLLSFLEYRIWVLAMQGMTTWLASSKKPWTLETLMKYWQHLTCLVIICY